MNPSAKSMWAAYLQILGEVPAATDRTCTAWHFCDNERDADELAELARTGRKRATASCLWTCEHEGGPLPKVGDLSVILDWKGEAQCVIRTTRIDLVPFAEVTEEFAWTEGEGDRSLDHWRQGHWQFFSRELQAFGREPDPSMPVLCERFEVVFGGRD